MPSNSINSTGEPPKKQLKKVTTGKVTIKQESEIQKLAHNFLAEDLQTIREKLWTDYILPGIKNMVCSAVNIALFGVDRSRTNTNGYSQQRIIDRFNQRAYQPNGAGGLFTLISPNVDMRQLDIWYQLMAYLNENNI